MWAAAWAGTVALGGSGHPLVPSPAPSTKSGLRCLSALRCTELGVQRDTPFLLLCPTLSQCNCSSPQWPSQTPQLPDAPAQRSSAVLLGGGCRRRNWILEQFLTLERGTAICPKEGQFKWSRGLENRFTCNQTVRLKLAKGQMTPLCTRPPSPAHLVKDDTTVILNKQCHQTQNTSIQRKSVTF